MTRAVLAETSRHTKYVIANAAVIGSRKCFDECIMIETMLAVMPNLSRHQSDGQNHKQPYGNCFSHLIAILAYFQENSMGLDS